MDGPAATPPPDGARLPAPESTASFAESTSVAAEHLPGGAEYLALAERGLRRMFDPATGRFAQTGRGRSTNDPAGAGSLTPEGSSVRYTAIAGLGIAKLPVERQKGVLAGAQAGDLIASTMGAALTGTDPGAVALATWLAGELADPDARSGPGGTGGHRPEVVAGVQAIEAFVAAGTALLTVDQAWMLTALIAHGLNDETRSCAAELADRLIRNQAPGGIFPYLLPPTAGHRLRRHVGCFADQVYPIQALARYAAATGDARALRAANRCAGRIVELQGPAGQWWWHYDARTSAVVEPYPVYSVHQHAMAPMALADLQAAGGDDHRAAVALGLAWLRDHPESTHPLIDPGSGVIWRKIGRREPPKAMRRLRSVTTAIRPGLRLGAVDRFFPPVRIDLECRPYELGWLLYAWVPD